MEETDDKKAGAEGYLILDRNGVISEAEFPGSQTLARIFLPRKPFAICVDRDYQDAFALHRSKLAESGTLQYVELKVESPDGAEVVVSLESTPETDLIGGISRIRCVVRDITDLRRHEDSIAPRLRRKTMQELEDEAQELRWTNEDLAASLAIHKAVLDALPDALMIADADGHFVSCNRQFILMWRIGAELLESRDSRRIIQAMKAELKESAGFTRDFIGLRDTPGIEVHEHMELADGRVLELYSAPYGIDSAGHPLGRFFRFRDVTAHVREEAVLRAALESTGTRLESSDAELASLRDDERELRASLKSVESALVRQNEGHDKVRQELMMELSRINGELDLALSARGEAESARNAIEDKAAQLASALESEHGALARAEAAHAYLTRLVETLHVPLAVVGGDMHAVTANRAFLRAFDIKSGEVSGNRYIYEIGRGKFNLPAVRKLLTDALQSKADSGEIEEEFEVSALGPRLLLCHARRFQAGPGGKVKVLVSFEDVTLLRTIERELDEKQKILSTLIPASQGGKPLATVSGRSVEEVQRSFASLLGKSAKKRV